jgi:hypothetical protein
MRGAKRAASPRRARQPPPGETRDRSACVPGGRLAISDDTQPCVLEARRNLEAKAEERGRGEARTAAGWAGEKA